MCSITDALLEFHMRHSQRQCSEGHDTVQSPLKAPLFIFLSDGTSADVEEIHA